MYWILPTVFCTVCYLLIYNSRPCFQFFKAQGTSIVVPVISQTKPRQVGSAITSERMILHGKQSGWHCVAEEFKGSASLNFSRPFPERFHRHKPQEGARTSMRSTSTMCPSRVCFSSRVILG